jgi:hypothetical protein
LERASGVPPIERSDDAAPFAEARHALPEIDTTVNATQRILTAPDDFGANLLSERLALVALSVARGAYGSGETAMTRAVFLLTGEKDYDREQLKALVSQRSAMELDIAFLRAVADVMEELESERLDAQKKGGA